MSLKYYVTQKRCKEYIARTQPKFASKRAFEKEVKKLLEEYKDYPDNNINQKRFFTRVLKISKESLVNKKK